MKILYRLKRKSAHLSRNQVTVLFSDLKDSTHYWDTHGDEKGRLMIDYINRLLMPIIHRYKGKVVKTIGDAIMAKFKKPGHAVKAAIAMQQMLAREREKSQRQILHVRIGIHTGQAIIEKKDVFGDMVNVAARIEDRAKGDEILVSSRTAAKCRKKEYCLKPLGKTRLKGKESEVSIYECQWSASPSLIDHLQVSPHQPILRRQKIELFIHIFASAAMLLFLFFRYFRYLMADAETGLRCICNPSGFLNNPLLMAVILFAAVCLMFLFMIIKKKTPTLLLRLFKGGCYSVIGFALGYWAVQLAPIPMTQNWNEPMYESSRLFVEIKEHETIVRKTPSLSAPVITNVPYGAILLLLDVQSDGNLTWNKVRLNDLEQGWILRVIPPQMGVPSKRLSLANKFVFRYLDLYALLTGVIGFVWGFLHLRRHLV